MSRGDTALNPLERDGTNRNERLVPSLDPRSAPVEERDVAEWLLYARNFAQHLEFFPLASPEAPSTDWSDFIDDDVTTLVAHIGAYDADSWRGRSIEQAAAVASSGAPFEALAALLQPLWQMVDDINEWYRRSPRQTQLRTRLERFIRGSLAEALAEAWAYGLRLEELGVADVVPDDDAQDPWVVNGSAPSADPTFLPTAAPAEATDGAQRIMRVVDRFHAVLVALRSEAPGYLAETLERYPWHQPHAALYLSYLLLLRHVRDRINESTSRHLDFYYRDVLQLGREHAEPDQVHVVLELARGLDTHRVDVGTQLKAGKDTGGNAITFVTDSELVANRAEIDSVRTVYLDVDPSGRVSNLHAAAPADSADGKGAEIVSEDGSWSTFGSSSMPYGTIGFAVAAPALHLAQGDRTVTVVVHTRHNGGLLTEQQRRVANNELRDNLTVWASGEETWLRASTDSVSVEDVGPGRRAITFELTFARDVDPITSYDNEALQEGFDTAHPLLKFVIDNDGLAAEGGIRLADRSAMEEFSDTTSTHHRGAIVHHEGRVYRALSTYEGVGFRPANNPNIWHHLRPAYAYRHLRGLLVDQIEITVEAKGLNDLLLENDTGPLDTAKPFHPFGTLPRVGSNFLIGSAEVFGKRLTGVTLHLKWAGLPETGFKKHYAGYVGTPDVESNGHFTASFDVLDNGAWRPVAGRDAERLFGVDNKEPEHSIPLWQNPIAPLLAGNADLAGLERYGPSVQRGFVRARLDEDFLHSRYAASLSAHALSISLAEAPPTDPASTPPHVPYTPLLEELHLDYQAGESIDLTKPARRGDPDRTTGAAVFQIWPFGTRKIPSGANDRLLPEFEVTVRYPDGSTATAPAAGTLYVSLSDLEPEKRPTLSLLVQVAEGTADPTLRAPAVSWSYLADDEWVDFAAGEILADETNDLTTSGIVRFSTPSTMSSDNSTLPSGLHWIKASVDRDAAGTVKAVALHTQAVTATFADDDNVADRVATPLPADTITKLVTRRAAVKSVTQPGASYGGRAAESDSGYRVRVSERLRHKHRAVTMEDYERIVLERFPEIYKARCINHTGIGNEFAPGKVRLVVVPDLREKSAVDPLRPRVSVGTLERVERYLRELASDFADIEVTNPDYEEVRARFRVRFRPGYDIGYYTKQLNDDIIQLLSPWRYDDSADLAFGGRIHRSWLLAAIEDFDYVDFLADFQIDHVTHPGSGTTRVDVEDARATRSSTVLVSARNHQVTHDLVSCLDEGGLPTTAPPAPPSLLYDQPGPRFLGNASSRELHDRWNLTEACQIDEIGADRRYHFASVEAATPFEYDPCAYCSGGSPSDLLASAPDDLAQPPPAASSGTPPDPPLDPAPGLRYLGNSTSRELHDRWNLTTACHEDEIDVDRSYYYATTEEAQRNGYDFCAHCFGRDRSRR